MATPIEDYMTQLIDQHKLRESTADDAYQNSLTQSQADESDALTSIMNQPFDMTARSYNMNPDEWVGKEQEARQKMAAMVSNQFVQQRAQIVDSKTQNKASAQNDLMGTLSRLHSVNSQGITEMDKYAPKDASLRSQLVFDPQSGTVQQQAKTLPDEGAVRIKELASYLQLPESVVADQQAKERVVQNDAAWKTSQRLLKLDYQNARNKRAEVKDAYDTHKRNLSLAQEPREAEKAQWARALQRADASTKFSEMSPQQVDQVIANPDTPEEMKVSAAIGANVRKGIVAARMLTTEKDRIKVLHTIANDGLKTNTAYQTLLGKGVVDEKVLGLALAAAEKQMKIEGIKTETYNADETQDDFYFAQPPNTGQSLNDYEAEKNKFQIDAEGNIVRDSTGGLMRQNSNPLDELINTKRATQKLKQADEYKRRWYR